jgi:hypothetical protein
MRWQGAVLARLRGNAGFQAVVGLDGDNRRKAYWDEAPEGVPRPYVTLFDPSEIRPQNLKGWDLPEARLQIDAWADSKNETIEIMEAALAALIPGGTNNGVTFQRAEVTIGPHGLNGERDGNMPIKRRMAELMLRYQAT